MMENKEKTLESLSSERNNLNEMREFITERWNVKRSVCYNNRWNFIYSRL